MNAAPPIQSVSPAMLEGVYRLLAEEKFTSGPFMLFDKDRGIFLTAVVVEGVIVSWIMTSCASQEEADQEAAKTKFIAESLAAQIAGAGKHSGSSDLH